jgi:hypothetical protein
MTITELREIAATSGIQHAEFCLEQHTTQIGRDAADPLWIEMARLVADYADAHDGLDQMPDVA